MSGDDYSDFSMIDLLRLELETHTKALEKGIIAAENSDTPSIIEPLMRAAHSIKGAARIVGLNIAVTLAHAMEDVLSEAMKGKFKLSASHSDLLLKGNDFFKALSMLPAVDIPAALENSIQEVETLSGLIRDLLKIEVAKPQLSRKAKIVSKATETGIQIDEPGSLAQDEPKAVLLEPEKIAVPEKDIQESISTNVKEPPVHNEDAIYVRVISKNLTKMLGLAGEIKIQTRFTHPFSVNLVKLKNELSDLSAIIEDVSDSIQNKDLIEQAIDRLGDTYASIDKITTLLNRKIEEFDKFSIRLNQLAENLNSELISSRMRPFADGVHGLPRVVRDIARKMNKKANLTIIGSDTKVDRDILESLESPLSHLLSNAIDHAIEFPEERISLGKLPEGKLTIEAVHRAGMLNISISDDGRGIDLEDLRWKIEDRGFVNKEMAKKLSNSELLDFLFLPGFTTRNNVTEMSGRGIGLDIVLTMVQRSGGSIRVETIKGGGTTFNLQLPITLSVVRSLIFKISGELFAMPLSRIERIAKLDPKDLNQLEDRQYYASFAGNSGIINASEVLQLKENKCADELISLIFLNDRFNSYGIVVDKFLGERDLVVIPLDPKLGKIPNISAGAIIEDGSPLLILEVDELVRSIDNIFTYGKPGKVSLGNKTESERVKRILVVDDSLTVREVERKLLEHAGYEVVVAVDGVDGFNVLQTNTFDLVITDVDMPRMNGIEFVKKMRADSRYKSMPIMIVSYKDREEDKLRGFDAGANYYLAKSSFHDESLINAVRDLI